MTFHAIAATRRAFLAGAGLVIGFAVAPRGFAAIAAQGVEAGGGALPAMNAFVKVGTDDTVTILSKHIEMGQGPFTGLATLIAEELDADWSQMRAVAFACRRQGIRQPRFTACKAPVARRPSPIPTNSIEPPARRLAPCWLPPLPRSGACRPAEITVSKGRIKHAASGKESGFGALADKAAAQTPPVEPSSKDPKDFVLIGKELPKLDTLVKSTGKAVYTLDVLADNMLVARGRALRSFRSDSKILRRCGSPQGAGRRRRQTGAARRRRLCQQHVRGLERTRSTHRRMGSLQGRNPLQQRTRSRFRKDVFGKGPGGSQPRRCRRGFLGEGHPEPGSRDRVSIPGACADGTARRRVRESR